MKRSLFLLPAALLLISGVSQAEAASKSHAAKPVASAHHTHHKKAHRMMASMHSEKSKSCSAEANAKKLHGKARKSFRRACMKKSHA